MFSKNSTSMAWNASKRIYPGVHYPLTTDDDEPITDPYLHDQLMGAGHQSEAVGVVEGFGDVLTEGVPSTSGRDAPPTAVIGVRPQQVAHWALRERDGGGTKQTGNQSAACGRDLDTTAPITPRTEGIETQRPSLVRSKVSTSICLRKFEVQFEPMGLVRLPHVGLLAGGPELVCDPECLWRETSLRGDRRSEIKKQTNKKNVKIHRRHGNEKTGKGVSGERRVQPVRRPAR